MKKWEILLYLNERIDASIRNKKFLEERLEKLEKEGLIYNHGEHKFEKVNPAKYDETKMFLMESIHWYKASLDTFNSVKRAIFLEGK